MLTNGLDFGEILSATRGGKPSVVQIRANNLSVDLIGSKAIAALRQMHTDLEQGALITLYPERTRMRLLPLHRP